MRKFLLMVIVVLVFVAIFVFTTKTSAQAAEVSDLLNLERDYLIIVNDDNPYEFGGEYDRALQGDLVYAADVLYGEPTGLERAAYLAFTELQGTYG